MASTLQPSKLHFTDLIRAATVGIRTRKQRAALSALGIMIGIMAIGRVSGGYINPAITISAFVSGNIGLIKTVLYVGAQVGGAIVAALALDSVAFDRNDLGVHALGADVTSGDGFALEFILTFFLAFAVFATAIDKRGMSMLAPIAIGTVVAVDHLVAINLTGASMNPARSIGPAVVHNAWADHWVYWAGPIAGALVAGIVYMLIFGTRADRDRMGALSLDDPVIQR